MNPPILKPLDSPITTDIDSRFPSVYAKRSTLGPKNATRFKHVFDTMIQTRKDGQLVASELGLKPNTLYVALNDALRFLAQQETTSVKPYSEFRNDITIRKIKDGVLLFFKKDFANAITTATSNLKSNEGFQPAGWKEKLKLDLEKAEPNQTINGRFNLSQEDIDWIENLLCEYPDSESEITSVGYRITK